MRPLAALLLSLLAVPCLAAEVDEVSVSHDGARYTVHMSARLDAQPRAAYAAFSDFDRLPQLNDAIEEVERIAGAPPGATRLRTQVRMCVAFFCKHLKQVQDIREAHPAGGYGLEATVLPQLSDLRYGAARWRMTGCAGQTCLEFSAELEPGFWVPPVIGPWLIQRKLRQEAEVTARGIEKLARDYGG